MYDLKESKKLQQLSSTEDRPIFEDLEGSRPRTWLSRPRPRISKTALEAATFASSHQLSDIIFWCGVCRSSTIFAFFSKTTTRICANFFQGL